MNLKDIVNGKILIIGVDTLPLTLTNDAPEVFTYDGVEYDIKDKCCRATALGIRTWQIANELKGNQITILIPDINYPGEKYIANTEFNIKPYDYKKSVYEYSKDIAEYIEEHDTIIFHMIGGIGFKNYWLIPEDKVAIYDGFENQLFSMPYAFMNYDEDFKQKHTGRFKFWYEKAIKRAEYILYCNEPMRHFYESQLYLNGKLGYDNYQRSPLVKLPYILENNDLGINKNIGYLYHNQECSQKLLWYGPAYPWSNAKYLLNMIKDNLNIELDFFAVKHPRYKNSWDASLFENLPSNVRVIEEYIDDRWNIYKKYDAGILLTTNDVIDTYVTSCRLYDMLSFGLPIITNEINPIFKEIEMEKERYNLKKVIVEDTLFNGMKKISVSW